MTEPSRPEYAYIAHHDVCGAISVAMVDDPAHKRVVAREVAALIREGRSVERVAIAVVRESPWCKCHAAIAAEGEG